MCFQSGSVRYSGIWSVLYHWVQVDFVSISELKIQFTPTKMRGWCSGENLEEGSESEIEFQALRIDFSPPLWCFLLMVLSIWLELWERTQKKESQILKHSKDTPLLMNALESNQQYGPRQPRYQDVTDNQKTVSSRNLRCGQWCCAQVLCFRSRRRYPLSNCSGASERFPRMLNTQC